ncbi:integrin alpha-7 [Onychostruthus taczanowskii]|uniref:integrin alpha-7 n=1 Tax=Onychostruthus taczanowskii TaxID=356909 RepID=UPI001B80DFC7|nr:integrin alpha-7 [Onychostruthus taczanowskii]
MASGGCGGRPGLRRGPPGLCRGPPGLSRWLPWVSLWLPGLCRWLPGLSRGLTGLSRGLPGLSLWLPALSLWLPWVSLWLPALSPWPPAAAAFNLDGSSPVLKDGERGSLFGAAVALHRQLSPEPRAWLLVGAPQALALPGQGANRTGGLFACPLTTELSDCWRVPIDEGADPERESKENQWLGVSVKSQGPGGKIVTCAHRYEVRHRVRQPLETRDVIGRCFVLSQDLRLRDELDGGEWKFCEGRPPGHERFGTCQQGLAAAFSPDRRYVLLGAPGTYNWKGTVRLEQLRQSSLDLLRPDSGPFEAGGEKEQDPSQIPVPANSYFGFSVDSGPGVTRRQQLSFVTGAPRANHTGAVVILRRDSASRLVAEAVLGGHQLSSAFGHALALLDLNSDGCAGTAGCHWDTGHCHLGHGHWDTVTGTRALGHCHCHLGHCHWVTGPLGRGLAPQIPPNFPPDLAVGAPFDGAGKVFIYHGSALGIVTRPAQVLDGEAVGVSAFGYSLSGGLDVDGNLHPDLLVGSLSDTVVLYRARPVVHVSRNVSVQPPLIDLERSTCGDGHGVCLEVRACFSYTASPGSDSPPLELQLLLEADSERRGRGLQPRGSFPARGPAEPEHRLGTRLELPRPGERRCVPAAFRLHDDIRDKLRPLDVTVAFGIAGTRGWHRGGRGTALPPLAPALSPRQPSTLRTEVHFLRQGCGDDKICQSHLELRPRFCARLGDSDFLPLPRDEDGTAIFAVSDQKDVALEVQVTNEPSDPAQPHRDGDDAHQALLVATFPPELPYAAMRAEEPAGTGVGTGPHFPPLPQVRLFLILSTSGISIHTTDLEVQLELSTTSEQPGLEPVVARARVVIELPLAVTGVAVPPRLFFGGQVLGESAVKRESQVGSAVRFEVTVSQRGPVLKTPGSAALTVQWPLELPNGKWLLYPLSLEMGTPPVPCSPPANPLRLALERPGRGDPPSEPPARSWWVPTGRRRRNVTLDCARGTARCRPFRCPLPSLERSELRARGRLWNGTFLEEFLDVENLELMVRAEVSVTSPRGNVVIKDAVAQPTLSPLSQDCARGTARCRPFRCPLPSLERSELRARGRLWNGTFLEEFLDVENLELMVRAEVSVTSPRGNVVIKDAVAQMSVSLHLDPGVAVTAVPWWVLPLAVLLGLLLLALLVLGLWKLGFFRRAAPPPAVPRFRAVRIPREQRPQAREGRTGTILRPQWAAGPADRDGDSAAPGPA